MKTAEEVAPGYDACCKMYNSKCFICLRGMLQALYIDVTKVDWDVADVVMAIHICFKCISQMFHLDVAKVDLDVYMYVASIRFKCFYVFDTYVCKCFIWMLQMFAMVFKYFSSIFVSVSNAYFKCFIYLFLYVTTVASKCFKSRLCVAHVMRVRSGWWRGRRSGRRPKRHGPIAGTLAREPNALCARSLPVRAVPGC
jgi:hypothetical protein